MNTDADMNNGVIFVHYFTKIIEVLSNRYLDSP